MDELIIEKSFNMKRRFFDDGNTRSYDFRITQLKKLKTVIKKNEKEILEALYLDLHKSAFEAFTSEIGIIYEEINFTINHLKSWMSLEKVPVPIVLLPSKGYIYSEPLGVALIIGPWNYPFQLLFAPLIGAISSGNCAMLKPSDQSKHISNLVSKIISETFQEEYVSVVQGPGAMLGPMLIDKFRFDHIFFTGSAAIGRKILAMASNHLTPVTLELGGKSPVIVHKDANIDVAAKRITWSKYFNAGQTCVCPDYLLIHESIKDEFLDKMKFYIKEFFGDKPIESESFGRIINEKRFDILKGLFDEGDIIIGGESDRDSNFISPTIIDGINVDSKIMKEEIFGPILPVITYKDIHEVLDIVRRNRYPLALYLYTKNKDIENFILENIEFGGGCINNGLVHLANSTLPFGGVGNSGMGSYHGKCSFDVFSHKKSILKTGEWLDPPLRYAPYSKLKLDIAKKFFK
ncbi:MAG TPA: aldehyde dehydrogenase [Clostridiaceae bacterium]